MKIVFAFALALASASSDYRGPTQTSERLQHLQTMSIDGSARSLAADDKGLAATGSQKWPLTMQDVNLFVVTLARSPHRWKHFLSSGYGERDFPRLQRFEGVDGRTVNPKNDSRLSVTARVTIMRGHRRDHTDINTLGMVGCYLSHVALWRKVVDDDLPLAVAMEDDAYVTSTQRDRVDGLLAQLPPPTEWDVLILGHAHPPTQTPSKRFPGFGDVTYWYGTIAYVVSKRGAQRLLAQALPILFQVDGYMAYMAKLGQLTVVHRKDGQDVRSLFGTISSVQDTCHLCDLPHDYNRVADILFWIVLGIALAIGGSVSWDKGWPQAAAGWLVWKAGVSSAWRCALCAFLPCLRRIEAAGAGLGLDEPGDLALGGGGTGGLTSGVAGSAQPVERLVSGAPSVSQGDGSGTHFAGLGAESPGKSG